MRLRGWKKYGAGAGGMLVLVMALLLATGWGSAVAAQVSSVFVTNDAAHPVPVHEQGDSDSRTQLKRQYRPTRRINTNLGRPGGVGLRLFADVRADRRQLRSRTPPRRGTRFLRPVSRFHRHHRAESAAGLT
jgi:hypothetical protein